MTKTTKNTDRELRIGLIGTGLLGTFIGGEFHQHSGATVAALADVSESARTNAGETFTIPEEARYADFEEMLAGENLDAVVICTPHTLHYEQIVVALEAGVHIFCEKPLTTDLGHARDVVRRVEESDQVLMVGYQRHLNPAFAMARERWATGELVPRQITAEISQNWYTRFHDQWRTDPDLSGGGILYDTGSHLVDAVLWTTGLEPSKVGARMAFADSEERVDMRSSLVVEFENGARATISILGDAPCVREHIHIWDAEGAIYLDGRQWEPRTVTRIDGENTDHIPYIDRSSQQNRAEAFVETIREGTEPPATAEDALVVTAVTEAAYEAAHSGEWVDIDGSL